MTQPRSALVSLDDTPWYHCVCRCVRRAFLCGDDTFSGQNFDHRRGWIADRIKVLSAVFAIDIAAYAVMSNHYHIIMRIDRDRALDWSVEAVLKRWTTLYTGSSLVNKYLSDARSEMSQGEIDLVLELAETYRNRLFDLSWFMRSLNETIARMANAEDRVKGRFWEGRYKSQALLDEQAILTAMTYVDLNPIRAGMAETPETSDYTAIQERMVGLPLKETETTHPNPPMGKIKPNATPTNNDQSETLQPEATIKKLPQAALMPFDATGQTPWAIPFAFNDYLVLVDWTGRAVHPLKRGFIPNHHPAILDRLGINTEQFIRYADHFLKDFGSAVGAPKAMTDLCARRQSKFLRGMTASARLFKGQDAA